MRRRCRVGCSFAGKIVRVSANPHLANAGVDFIVRSPPLPRHQSSVSRVGAIGCWYHTSDSRTIARTHFRDNRTDTQARRVGAPGSRPSNRRWRQLPCNFPSI